MLGTGMGRKKSEESIMSQPRPPLALPALVLVAAVLFAYGSSLHNGFIWDDPEYVINNATLRTLDGLSRIWFEPGATPQYYPMVFTGFWIEYHLWGLDTFGYHLVNVLLHGLNAVLLFLLCRRLAVPGAWVVALLFALHPVQVESVAWITERKNVLSLFFYLSAFLVYFHPDRSQPGSSQPWSSRPWYLRPGYFLALALFLFALWSKTVTCTLPAAMLLVLWWKKPRLGRQEIVPLLPFFVMGLVLAFVTVWMEKTHVGAQGEAWSLGLGGRCLLAGRIPWFYAWKLVAPVDLAFIYHRWSVDPGVAWQYLFPAALVGGVLFLWLMRRRLGKGPLVAVLIFVGSLVPALGFFNVYPMRFSYVAIIFSTWPRLP
jgi:hypothetical protein